MTRLVDVAWDTDEEEVEGLPARVAVPASLDEGDITDWLSDEYGWLVFRWDFVVPGMTQLAKARTKKNPRKRRRDRYVATRPSHNPKPSTLPPVLQRELGDPDIWWSYVDENDNTTFTADKMEAREESRRHGRGVFWEHRKKWPNPQRDASLDYRPIFVGSKGPRKYAGSKPVTLKLVENPCAVSDVMFIATARGRPYTGPTRQLIAAHGAPEVARVVGNIIRAAPADRNSSKQAVLARLRKMHALTEARE